MTVWKLMHALKFDFDAVVDAIVVDSENIESWTSWRHMVQNNSSTSVGGIMIKIKWLVIIQDNVTNDITNISLNMYP